MSDTTPEPNIPKPSLPKPNIPKPSIPAPNLNRGGAAPPVSAVETGAMEAPVKKPEAKEEEETSTIEYSETLLPQRIIAGLIDSVAAGIAASLLSSLLPDFLSILSTVLAFTYLLSKDSLPFLDGQSLGKKLMKIRAVTAEGAPLTNNFKAGALRNIFTAIPILALVEIIILHNREKAPNAGLRLGDDFAKTKVISVAAPESKEVLEESEEG